MEILFKKLKFAFPKAIIQFDKNYMSFTFGGGLYYQLRVQKDKVRMMATNYPAKAKLGECLKLIKKHGLEGKNINGKEIIFEIGVRNPEIFTLRLELPYSGNQLDNDNFINIVVDSSAKFHEAILPLVNHFMKQPVGDLYTLMGGKLDTVSASAPTIKHIKSQSSKVSEATHSLQQKLASAIVEKYPDAVVKKIDVDNYLDIHIPSVYPKKGTHIGINTAKGLIKIVFYCREESFNEQVLANSKKIEAYGQGLRIKDNPTFSDVSKAIEATINFAEEIKRASSTVPLSARKASAEKSPKPKKKAQSDTTNKTKEKAALTKSEELETDFQKMVKAYKEGDLEKVAEFIEKGNPPLQFNMDQSVIENELISVCAAQEVDLNALKKIIKRGDDLNARNIDSDRYTAVHYCAWDGKTEALSLLLKSGALPDIVGADGRTPIHLAVALGHIDVVKILLSAGADIERIIPDGNKFYSKDGATALREALINQRWEIIDLLLEAGAEIINLTEPCVESYKGKNDLFDVIRLLAEDGEYQYGNFDENKLKELENRVKDLDNELTSVADSLFEGWLKENHVINEIKKTILSESEEAEEDTEETDLSDFDVDDISVINYICDKIKKEKYLTNLLYVNKTLSDKGFNVDRHQAYFFDSNVLISDKEMEGFLLVNMDGFYSNCVNDDEMQMIFSWSGVNDIEYEENGDDCSIDIVADQGRLTIKKEESHSLKILYTFYRYLWKKVNDKFKHESIIIWNDVWKMGIKPIGFSDFLDYYTFDVSQEEDEVEDTGDEEELEDVVEESDDEASEDNQTEEDEEENADEVEDMLPFYFGKSYEKQYLRFQEIAEKTGILINEIKKEPNTKERDELWEIVRIFADRIYQIDAQQNQDKEELNTLCFYNIVALHWCDLMVNDKRFSFTDGRFRRDVLALALCFYARIDRSYDYYDHVKLRFIMPHMQFSVLLWSINSIVNLGQDNLFGIFTQEQAQKAQQLFTEIDKQNQASGGYGVVAPNKMPDNHPLKAIWSELFSLFSNVRIPYQFIRSYISLELPKRTFLQDLLSGKGNNNPGVNVTLLDTDKQKNITYLDRQIAHKQFPEDWNLYDDLALAYIYFATSDGNLSKEEKEKIITLIGEWVGEQDENKLNQIVNVSIAKAQALFGKDNSVERFSFVLENIRRSFYVNYDNDQKKTHIQLLNVFKDLLYIAWADEEVKNVEIDLLKLIMNEWNIDKSELENENLSFFHDDDDDTDEYFDTYDGGDRPKLLVSSKQVLSDDEIQRLIQNKGAYLLLGSLTQITDKQSEILSTHQGGVYLDGLSSLKDSQYSFLSKVKGTLSFDGITNLSDEQASFFSNHEGKLNLNGLVSITDKQAEFLSKNQGDISLNSLTLLSDKQALSLSKVKGDLSLNGLEVLTDKQAESFSNHEGELSLDGVNNLTDKQAAFLAKHKGDLFLDSLENLTDNQAVALSKHHGTLTLNGLKSLSVIAARALAGREGGISLDGLASMTKEIASLFSKHKGGYLSLSGIETLDDNSLMMLAKREGDLYLNRIAAISDPVAIAFSKHEGDLYLNGVTTLTDKAAVALANHEGELSMEGLVSLSEVAAEALAAKGIEISEDEDSSS